MKAVVCTRYGGPELLELQDWPARPPGPGEVRVELHAAGVNFANLLLIAGRYQVEKQPPFVPGTEGAGVVAEVGAGVAGFAPGDRVLVQDNAGHGCFAMETTLPATRVARIPDALAWTDAAGFPIAFGTAWYALAERARVEPGETLVVHGACGGVGLAAVQVGKALGARVIATGGDDAKLVAAMGFGADETINYRKEDLKARMLALTDGRGADAVLDPVGGDAFDASVRASALHGRIVVVGFASGRIPSAACNAVLFRGLSVVGAPYGTHTQRNPAAWAARMAALLDLAVRGTLRPIVTRTWPLADAGAALAAVARREVLGKAVLRCR